MKNLVQINGKFHFHSYLSNQLFLWVTKQHKREIVITWMDDSVRRECNQTTDVSEHPNQALVEQFIAWEVFVTIKFLQVLAILGFK